MGNGKLLNDTEDLFRENILLLTAHKSKQWRSNNWGFFHSKIIYLWMTLRRSKPGQSLCTKTLAGIVKENTASK
jgi:hypothetical protein